MQMYSYTQITYIPSHAEVIPNTNKKKLCYILYIKKKKERKKERKGHSQIQKL